MRNRQESMKITNTSYLLCMQILILCMFIPKVSSARKHQDTCNRLCGGLSIPFPFGIGENGCYLNSWYEVTCNSSGPFLTRINRELVNISLPNYGDGYGKVHIKVPVSSSGCSSSNGRGKSQPLNVSGEGSPFFVTQENVLAAVGCNSRGFLTDIEPQIIGCESSCDERNRSSSGREARSEICSGYNCCQTRIPEWQTQVIGVNVETQQGGGCGVAFLTSEKYSPSNVPKAENFDADGYTVVELGWHYDSSSSSPHYMDLLGCQNATGTGYCFNTSCYCSYGYFSGFSYTDCVCDFQYPGNPYDEFGCVVIDRCQQEKGHEKCKKNERCVNIRGSFKCEPKHLNPVIKGVLIGSALLFFVMGVLGLYKYLKKEQRIYRRRKFFRRNGGLLLKQQLTRKEGTIETSKIFTSKELEKATDSFNKNRVLGQGGQGTVYKGMLVDGRIVAVKRSKALDEDRVEEFINELVVLAQINHRNIVKLLGCCLETNVPILVYEFVPNGDLFKRLHDDESDDYAMTWDVRLHIMIEIAGAVSYLHSAASFPIYHRDIKTTNILLDEKYRAKVSDFGTSRSITVDQTHLTTQVAGTIGYMDPEYFQTSKFSDKSDVYSFGVVLVELITGEKPSSRVWSEENRGFAARFVEAVKRNKVLDIVDDRIKGECDLDQVMATAKLATRCLNRKGKKRPNMREVSVELERIRSSPTDSEIHIEEDDDEEEDQAMSFNNDETWDDIMTAPASMLNNNASSSSDVEPLVARRTL